MRNSLYHYWNKYKDEILLVLIVVLVGFGGFGLGRLSVKEVKKEPVSIVGAIEQSKQVASVSNSANKTNSANLSNQATGSGEVVASKNGKVYHLPWCPGALKVKPENLISFKSAEEAKKAGLTPASNCKF